MIGKVVKRKGQHLLLVEENLGLPFMDPDQQSPVTISDVEVVADSFDEFLPILKREKHIRSLLNTVCRNEENVVGVVLSHDGERFIGVSLTGGEWSAMEPTMVSRSLYLHYVQRMPK